ncbi:MAG: hypothetical protein H0T53_15225 [Herpetosiphonaceae bacterium]|nr:hypothetical protein [Herpetosiphonaceae bacterium]
MFTDRWDDRSATVVLPVDERTSPELIDREREERLISCARTLLGGPAADPDAALLVLFRVVAESVIAADASYIATVKLDRVWAMRNAISSVYDLQEASVF